MASGTGTDKGEEKGAEDVMASIRQSLVDAIRNREYKTENGEALRVKLEYAGEKRSIEMKRPVNYGALRGKLRQMYGRHMTMFYTAANSEIIVPIRDQDDLDRAVELLDRTQPGRSLRIILSQLAIDDPPARSANAKAASCSSAGRYSPPPGTTPDQKSQFGLDAIPKFSRRGPRAMSTKSEGQFIPELDTEIPHCSCTAITAQYSIPKYSKRLSHSWIDPHRLPRFNSSRSAISERSSYCDPVCSRGPVRPQYTNRVDISRRRSFHSHLQHSSIRSPSSWASSSSESGMVPDICESPECGLLGAVSPTAPLNWRQGRCLGSGAFGQVYLCYDQDTGREFAVKRVLTCPNNAPQEKEVRTLENEITLLRSLHHERVVQYIGCQRDGDSLCIFIEYMPGGSVKDEIRQYGPLKEILVRKYTHHILEGLNYLHHYDIVHRDIKSANILRDTNGNVKIGDFGAGKRLQTICSQSAAGTFTGTPYYMAPEVINGKSYGRKADIWSLACTVVEMITGSTPWKHLEPMAALFKIATEHPQYTLPSSTSVQLEEFLQWLFTWDPEKRPSAKEALENVYISYY